jgi:POT family proton-dependent oligopeptide transporter
MRISQPDDAPVATPRDQSFFGHPKGLGFLLGAECGWGFAYYGLQNVLTLYMTGQLLHPGHVEHVIGFEAYQALLRRIFGPLSPLELASQTFGIATGFVYALPILGGLIADRWTGQRKAAAAGLLVLTAAHCLLIREQTFLIALLLIVLGTGLLKTALVGQIGRLYPADDDRRTRGFGLYLIALNTGAFVTPLISGTLGERLGWSWGFSAMAIGMGLGAVCYLAGIRYTPPDDIKPRRKGAAKPSLSARDGRIVLALLLLVVLDGVWAGVYNQAFNVFPVWADAHVERHVLGFLMPVTWFNTVDGVLTIAGTALAVRIWALQRGRGGAATDMGRISIGFALATAAYLVLALTSALAGAGKAPLLPALGFFLLVDFSIPWIDTTVMTMISRDAPAAIASTMLGVYYLATAFGNFLTGWLGALADKVSIPVFWLLHAGIYGAILLLVLLSRIKLSDALAAPQPAE